MTRFVRFFRLVVCVVWWTCLFAYVHIPLPHTLTPHLAIIPPQPTIQHVDDVNLRYQRHVNELSLGIGIPPLIHQQYEALRDFYHALHGDYWTWQNNYLKYGIPWNITKVNVNPCAEDWQGVVCVCDKVSCVVDKLGLPSYNLTGSLPLTINRLSNISTLVLLGNYITGSLPTTIGELKQLKSIDVFRNDMIGTVPSTFSHLHALLYLNLSNNHFSGLFPTSLYNLSQLQLIDFSINRFSGTLSSQIINWQNLSKFSVFTNRMQGGIPSQFYQLTTLVELNLGNNSFTGQLSPSMSNLQKLRTLIVEDNLLEGQIPVTWCQLHSLELFYLGRNLLTGTIPNCFANLTQIKVFYLSLNAFSGSIDVMFQNKFNLSYALYQSNQFEGQLIPIDLGSISTFKHLFAVSAYNNYLTGTIPDLLSKQPYLEYLDVGGNAMYGSIPTWISELNVLYYFYINDNMFSGKIPNNIGDKLKLIELYLDSNFLSGSLPEGLTKLLDLTEFYAQNNAFTGRIPNGFGNMVSLTAFIIRNNQLTGPIVNYDQVYKDVSMAYLDMSDNYLTGTLSPRIFQFPNLVTVAFSSNCFNGYIPSTLCESKTLVNVQLDGLSTASHCQRKIFPGLPFFSGFALTKSMSGSVPDCIYNMPKISSLHLSGNGLLGSLSDDILISPTLFELSLAHNIFTGSIPLAIQHHSWQNLDLSFNKFSGTLSSTFNEIGANGSLSLYINRISGKVPMSLKNTFEIEVLRGNMFECNAESSSLPTNDPEHSTYACGSDVANRTVYAWLGTSAGMGVLLLYWAYIFSRHLEAKKYKQQRNRRRSSSKDEEEGEAQEAESSKWSCTCEWMIQNIQDVINHIFNGYEYARNLCHYPLLIPYLEANPQEENNTDNIRATFASLLGQEDNHKIKSQGSIVKFMEFMRMIRNIFLLITIFTFVILMPIYSLLSIWESVYLYTYAWEISGVYLAGEASAICLFIAYMLLTLFVIVLLKVVSLPFSDLSYSTENDVLLRDSTMSERVTEDRFSSMIQTDQSVHTIQSGSSVSTDSGIQQHRPSLLAKLSKAHQDSPSQQRPSVISISSLPSVSTSTTANQSTEANSQQQTATPGNPNLRPSNDNTATAAPENKSKISERISLTILGIINFVVLVIIDAIYVEAYRKNPKNVFFIQFLLSIFKILWNEVSLWLMYPVVKRTVLRLLGYSAEEAIRQTSKPSIRSLSVSSKAALSLHRNTTHGLGAAGALSESSIHSETNSTISPMTAGLVHLSSQAASQTSDREKEEVQTETRESSRLSSLTDFTSLLSGFNWNPFQLSTSNLLDEYQTYVFVFSKSELQYFVYLMILNNIVIPSIAVSLVSSHCFYEAFFSTPPEETYTVYGCQYLLTIGKNLICLDDLTFTQTITYNTPFVYRYECSSALASRFTPVYIFMFLLIGVIIPILQMTLKHIYEKLLQEKANQTSLPRWKHGIFQFVSSALPHRFKRLPEKPTCKNFQIMNNERLLVRLSSYLTILLTFGIIFPPLAFAIFVAIYSITYFEQYGLGIVLKSATELEYYWYVPLLDRECQDIMESWFDTLWLIFPFACFTYAGILFDTVGDKYGWRHAAIPSIIIFALPMLVIVWHRIATYFKLPTITDYIYKRNRTFFNRLQYEFYQMTKVRRSSSSRTSNSFVSSKNVIELATRTVSKDVPLSTESVSNTQFVDNPAFRKPTNTDL